MMTFIIPLLIILSFVFIIREVVAYKQNLTLKYFFTPLITLLIAILAVVALNLYGVNKYRSLVLLGLIFGLVGDVLLMIEEVDFFKHGLFFFLLGHVFYIFAFADNFIWQEWNVIVLVFLIFTAIMYFAILLRQKTKGKILIGVAFYQVMLVLMLFFALAQFNYGVNVHSTLIASGAILFVISDMLLGINTFMKKIPHSTVFTWLFYAPAQTLLALACFSF